MFSRKDTTEVFFCFFYFFLSLTHFKLRVTANDVDSDNITCSKPNKDCICSEKATLKKLIYLDQGNIFTGNDETRGVLHVPKFTISAHQTFTHSASLVSTIITENMILCTARMYNNKVTRGLKYPGPIPIHHTALPSFLLGLNIWPYCQSRSRFTGRRDIYTDNKEILTVIVHGKFGRGSN